MDDSVDFDFYEIAIYEKLSGIELLSYQEIGKVDSFRLSDLSLEGLDFTLELGVGYEFRLRKVYEDGSLVDSSGVVFKIRKKYMILVLN